ncbi:PE family protein [Nocardia salmonicida]|uniref:PE family protein n=1 Tax=Nocardia salmonicida TaxID=53431 RepID=A0ABZ1NDG0_9NOCA|nr:PE family protein [Nocardia salmonicida]
MGEATGEMYDGVQFDAATAARASSGLDSLAERLTADLHAAEQALTIAPAGADEVSGRSAQTANEVASSYLASAQAGVEEMRKLAATLRVQSNRFGGMESDNAAGFGVEGAQSA